MEKLLFSGSATGDLNLWRASNRSWKTRKFTIVSVCKIFDMKVGLKMWRMKYLPPFFCQTQFMWKNRSRYFPLTVFVASASSSSLSLIFSRKVIQISSKTLRFIAFTKVREKVHFLFLSFSWRQGFKPRQKIGFRAIRKMC